MNFGRVSALPIYKFIKPAPSKWTCNQNFYVERWFMILSINWLYTGDTHADFSRFRDNPIAQDKNNYIVIAGDCGVNFFGGKRDARAWQIGRAHV